MCGHTNRARLERGRRPSIRHGKLLGQIRIRIARRELVAIDVVVAAMSENDELHTLCQTASRLATALLQAHFGDAASAVGAKLLSTNGRSVTLAELCRALRPAVFPPAIRSSLMLLMQQNLVLRDSSHKTGAAYLVKRALRRRPSCRSTLARNMCAPVSATDARDGCHTPATIPAIHLACARYFWRRGQRAVLPAPFFPRDALLAHPQGAAVTEELMLHGQLCQQAVRSFSTGAITHPCAGRRPSRF